MKKIGKKLVFHFYIGQEGLNTETNRLHFKCLEHYAAKVFDKAVFVISVDNIEEHKDDISKLENKITDIFNVQTLEFKVVSNDYLREAKTFYEEIAKKLKDTKELVFFGHNKGVTNIQKFGREKTLKWIAAMYFACFYNVNEVEDALTECRASAYGGLLNIITPDVAKAHERLVSELGKNKFLYTGTFFWINPQSIWQFLNNNEQEIPELNSRWYAENFLADVITEDMCTSPHDWRALNSFGAHDKILELINLAFPEDLLIQLNELYKVLGIEDAESKPVIEIVYIATNNYVNYMKDFLGTVQYFYPGAKKIIKILTNRDIKVEPPCDDVIKCEIVKMFDLFYPCINLHKTKFIEQLQHDDIADYIFYFDADTRFINKPDYDWEALRKSMDKGYFIMSPHPIYLISDTEYRTWFLNNLWSGGITEKNENFAAYIPSEQYTYVISSFFCGRKETVLHVCGGINEMIKSDMTWQKQYRIPRFSDENYFNKLVYNRENGLDTTYCIRVDYFTCIENTNDTFPATVFLFQKDGEEFKSEKR